MTEMYQGGYGVGSLEGLGQHTRLIGGLLIYAGAVISLAMALTKVRRLGMWMIPTVLYITGVALVAMPREES